MMGGDVYNAVPTIQRRKEIRFARAIGVLAGSGEGGGGRKDRRGTVETVR